MRRLAMVVAAMAAMTQGAAAGDLYSAAAAKVSRECVDLVRSRGWPNFEANYGNGMVPHFIADPQAYYWFATCMARTGFPLR